MKSNYLKQQAQCLMKQLGSKDLRNYVNTRMIRLLGRDRLEYLCSNTMNTVMQAVNPFLWTYDLKATVLRRRRETQDVVSFELLANQHWQPPQAGQYVELLVKIDGEEFERAYSVSELSGESFWITVKRQSQGKVSDWLHQQLQPGDELRLRGPFGQFVYRKQASLLVICAGSGITPCFALVQDLLQLPPDQRPQLTLYAQFSRPEDTIFAKTLMQWRQAGLDLQLAYSQEPAAGNTMPLSVQTFATLFPDFESREIYLCGPAGFNQQVLQALDAAGFPFSQLHLENFVPKTLSTQTAGAQGVLSEVYFSPYHCRIQMREEDRHKSLLELGLEHGLNLEKGCCKGICGSCKLVLQQGEVEGLQQGKVVYLCSAYPRSEKVVLGF